LDGVSFVARSAARRRAKQVGQKQADESSARPRTPGERGYSSTRVVIIPVAVKYLCKADIDPWAGKQLGQFEERLGWSRRDDIPILPRTVRLAEGLLSLREVEYLGHTRSGSLPQRRDYLMQQMLIQTEQELGILDSGDDVRARLVAIRTGTKGGVTAARTNRYARARPLVVPRQLPASWPRH